jgi:hypothetical protein
VTWETVSASGRIGVSAKIERECVLHPKRRSRVRPGGSFHLPTLGDLCITDGRDRAISQGFLSGDVSPTSLSQGRVYTINIRQAECRSCTSDPWESRSGLAPGAAGTSTPTHRYARTPTRFPPEIAVAIRYESSPGVKCPEKAYRGNLN